MGLYASLHHSGLNDANVVEWAIVLVASCPLNEVGNVETLNNLAKHGVLPIEMGRTTKGAINLFDGRGEAHAVASNGVEALLYLVEHVGGKNLSCNDVEL